MTAGLRETEQGYLMTDLAFPYGVYSMFSSEVLRFDRLGAHNRMLGVMAKIKDDLGGRITARGGVRKRLSEIDRKRQEHGADVARKILENAGARDIFKMRVIAAHPGGTAKIGDVVDSDLRTRFQNLYVCDASVIPASWGLPPAITVMALGKRLAKFLA
jgi:choline dehydrogenase-like flavoprotein